MASNSINNGSNVKTVAFQSDTRHEAKDKTIPKLSGDDASIRSKNNLDQSSSPLMGKAKIVLKKKGQLNQLINPVSASHKLGMNGGIELKSSQGFYLNENQILHPHHHHHHLPPSSINGSSVRVSSSSSSLQQFGSLTNLNSLGKYHSTNDIKLGIDTMGYRGANTSNLSGRDHSHYQSNPHFGYQTATASTRKWSQEQVYTTFYKKRDNNDIILIPDKFWEQEKSFVPFKKIWADHEQINSQLVTQYIQKKELGGQEDSSRKYKSQSNLDQDEDETHSQVHHQQQSNNNNHSNNNYNNQKNSKKNIRGVSSETAPVRLPLTSKQMKINNQTKHKGENGHENSLIQNHPQLKQHLRATDHTQFSNSKANKKQQISGGYLSEDVSNGMERSTGMLGSLTALDENYKKNGQKAGFLPRMGKGMINNSMMDLTQKDEIELQLNQNRYSQNVYDTKILEIEQQIYNEAYEKIQVTQQQLDKIAKKTRVYNKHNIVESLDTQSSQNQAKNNAGDKKNSVINNEREFAIQRPSIVCCWVENDQDIWKPQPRIGSSINIAGTDGKREMILIGGISSDMVKDVLVIDSETYQYDTLKHLQEIRKLEQEEYREEMLRRKQNKERRTSKLTKRNSLLFNVQVNGQNTGGTSTPTQKKQKESQQQSEKDKQQDYEDLFNKYLYGKDNFSQRYNHTTVEIQRKTKLLIFGGEILNNEANHSAGQARQKLRPHHRNCLNDLISFDLSTYEWRAHIGRGEIIEARRNHTATMVGVKHMVVIGGLNSEGRALDDMYILDINTFRWINVHVVHNKYVHPFTQGIAYHAVCFVSEDENSNSINILGNGYYNLLNQNSNHKDKKSGNPNQPSYIKEEGLYLFGGIDATNNYIRNKMFVLKQNGNPPQWIELNTIGRLPERRCGHSLNFMYNMSIVVLYGGKFETQNSTRYYDDLNVLNLKNLEWIQVNLEGNRKPPRAMHTTCVNHKQLIVFGGLNDKGFMKGNVEIIEFDQVIVFKMKRQSNYTLTLHLELTSKQQSKMEDPLLLELMQKGEQKDNQGASQQQNPLNMQKMKDRVFLIDPEQEREIKKHLDDLKNAPPTDQTEEKWKAPSKSQSTNTFQPNRFSNHTPLPVPQKTYLPLPLSILKKKDG